MHVTEKLIRYSLEPTIRAHFVRPTALLDDDLADRGTLTDDRRIALLRRILNYSIAASRAVVPTCIVIVRVAVVAAFER